MKNHDAGPRATSIAEISALTLKLFFAQRAMRAFWTFFDVALRDTDVNASQLCMLALLHHKEPMVFGDMADALAMDRSNLSSQLAPLFRRKLVAIIPHGGDRRKRQLVVTPKGRDVFGCSLARWSQAYQNLSPWIDHAHVDSLRDLFFALRDLHNEI
ncbi:MarR family transcriptional regulator [Trinickia symbiotica]|uniref:MarR family transcriptional regulator n=1 Tax=Trinickia symbiotica TaxID=863227 RepID=A0A2T3XZ40_9BURK|nr:MarR family transcriptional regulator [Trinickia symbiotica]PTB21777.1 MarR family transcriptional regulator [Trinickia symbiotica]